MGKMTIQEIAKILVEKNKLTQKEAGLFAQAMFEIVQQHLDSDGIVKVKGLGTFKMIRVEARESVSVRTGERVLIDSHSKVTFTPDATMKELVNKPFSQFETVVLNEGVEFDDLKDDLTEEELAEVDAMDEEQQPAIVPVAILEHEKPATQKEHEEPAAPEKPIVPVEMETSEEPVIAEEPVVAEEDKPSTEPLMEVVDLPDYPLSAMTPHKPAPSDKDEANASPKDAENASNDNDDSETSYDEDEESESHWKKTLGYCLLTLALMAASAYAGYWYGQRTVAPAPAEPTAAPVPEVVVNDSIEDLTVDSTATDSVKPANNPVTETVTAPVTTPQPAPVPQTEEEPFWKKYEAMDARVRTGAYHIIGTDHEVKVRQGETLSRIARRELGEGMSCYIEVYNGLKADAQLKEGQVIKVPKLKWKKSKK